MSLIKGRGRTGDGGQVGVSKRSGAPQRCLNFRMTPVCAVGLFLVPCGPNHSRFAIRTLRPALSFGSSEARGTSRSADLCFVLRLWLTGQRARLWRCKQSRGGGGLLLAGRRGGRAVVGEVHSTASDSWCPSKPEEREDGALCFPLRTERRCSPRRCCCCSSAERRPPLTVSTARALSRHLLLVRLHRDEEGKFDRAEDEQAPGAAVSCADVSARAWKKSHAQPSSWIYCNNLTQNWEVLSADHLGFCVSVCVSVCVPESNLLPLK